MIEYTTNKDESFSYEGATFSTPGSIEHQLMISQVKNKKAKILPYVEPNLTSEQIRDAALAAIDAYDFKDGRVIQIRLIDRDNLKGGIEKGTNVWKMLDNKVYSVTTAELQAALDDQESQIYKIWMAHFADLEVGKAKKGK